MKQRQHGIPDTAPQRYRSKYKLISVQQLQQQLLLPLPAAIHRCCCIFFLLDVLIVSTMIQSIPVTTAEFFNVTRRNITKFPDWKNQRNPYEEGCLYSHGLQHMPRTCNSDDTDTSKCSQNEMQYMEIRIHTGDWESITYESWIIQILLSELLHVPTTIDSGLENGGAMNFYNHQGDFSYGKYTLYDSLATAYFSEHGDCVPIIQSEGGRKSNVTCAHVIPESWRGTSVSCRVYKLCGWIKGSILTCFFNFAYFIYIMHGPNTTWHQGHNHRMKFATWYLKILLNHLKH
jgi:hypothetical protein